jgi:uncharacterized membrane protein YccC
VEENSAIAIGQALQRLNSSPERRNELVERGWAAFQANHDVIRLRSELVARLRELCRYDAVAGKNDVSIRDHALAGWQ